MVLGMVGSGTRDGYQGGDCRDGADEDEPTAMGGLGHAVLPSLVEWTKSILFINNND